MTVDGSIARVRPERSCLAGGEDIARGVVLPWDPGFQDGGPSRDRSWSRALDR